jgi:hypothetical protein
MPRTQQLKYRKILMRMGKIPFQALDLVTSDARNIVGTNSGNMLFAEAVFKTLSVDGIEIDRHGYGANAKRAEYINANYDALVLPMANSFRVAWSSMLDNYYQLINRLTIPVTIVGVGVQTSLDYDLSNLSPIDNVSKRLIGAILDRSASIGVRGECTAAYFRKLGFSGSLVDVIGCPSMFLHGRDFTIVDKGRLDTDSAIAINVTSSFKKSCFRDGLDLMLLLADKHIRKYRNSNLICQEGRSLSTMLWGAGKGTEFDGVSDESFRALTVGKRAKFFVDPSTWISYLRHADFCFGTRLHGNIAALLAGTPAMILASDSRTLELADFFDIPYRRMDTVNNHLDVADLADKVDFSKLMQRHAGHFDNYISFLQKNSLESIYNHPLMEEKFNERLCNIRFAPAAETATPEERSVLLAQFRRSALTRMDATDKLLIKANRRINRLEQLVCIKLGLTKKKIRDRKRFDGLRVVLKRLGKLFYKSKQPSHS